MKSKVPPELDRIADVVLRYHPKPKSKAGRGNPSPLLPHWGNALTGKDISMRETAKTADGPPDDEQFLIERAILRLLPQLLHAPRRHRCAGRGKGTQCHHLKN